MVALVTIQQVKQALRIDENDDDEILTLMISAASRRVIQHLKAQAQVLLDLDSGGDPVSAGVPDEVALATIMLVGYLFKNLDQDPEGDFHLGKLPLPVKSILYMLRDPALA